jgi:hypothetical protein
VGASSPLHPRKEPAINDAIGQRVRAVLALGIVNLLLAAAAVLVASVSTLR